MKKYSIKKILSASFIAYFLFVGIMAVAQSQNDTDSLEDLFGVEINEVSCDDKEQIINLFQSYHDTVKLMEQSFSGSLNKVRDFLDQTSASKQLRKKELDEHISQLNNAIYEMSSSKYTVSQKGEEIFTAIQGCLSK